MDLMICVSVFTITIISILWLLGFETLWLIWHTLPRDLYGAFIMAKIKKQINAMKKSDSTVAQVFEKTVQRYPERPMFKFQDKVWTFSQVNEEADSIAAYFQRKGYQKGWRKTFFTRPNLVKDKLPKNQISAATRIKFYF